MYLDVDFQLYGVDREVLIRSLDRLDFIIDLFHIVKVEVNAVGRALSGRDLIQLLLPVLLKIHQRIAEQLEADRGSDEVAGVDLHIIGLGAI